MGGEGSRGWIDSMETLDYVYKEISSLWLVCCLLMVRWGRPEVLWYQQYNEMS